MLIVQYTSDLQPRLKSCYPLDAYATKKENCWFLFLGKNDL